MNSDSWLRYIYQTLSTIITTGHQKSKFFKHFCLFSIMLVQYTKSQIFLFTTQNNGFIYINVSFTVTAFHKALTVKLLIFNSSRSVEYTCVLFTSFYSFWYYFKLRRSYVVFCVLITQYNNLVFESMIMWTEIFYNESMGSGFERMNQTME